MFRDGCPRQAGNALFRAAARDLRAWRQQHAHVEAARRVTDEVQLRDCQPAPAEYLPAKRAGASMQSAVSCTG
jgi:hypothetical protein